MTAISGLTSAYTTLKAPRAAAVRFSAQSDTPVMEHWQDLYQKLDQVPMEAVETAILQEPHGGRSIPIVNFPLDDKTFRLIRYPLGSVLVDSEEPSPGVNHTFVSGPTGGLNKGFIKDPTHGHLKETDPLYGQITTVLERLVQPAKDAIRQAEVAKAAAKAGLGYFITG